MMKSIDSIAEAVANMAEELLRSKERIIIAIDGRCGAGKSSLAQALKERLGCDVYRMDDFFLRPEQRNKARLSLPGENVDHERFLEELLKPLSRGESFSYRPFNCSTMSLGAPVKAGGGRIAVVEGTYSCHSELREYYDLKIFLTVDSHTQLARIRERNGEKMAERFRCEWIPLEEAYFAACKIGELCELAFST